MEILGIVTIGIIFDHPFKFNADITKAELTIDPTINCEFVATKLWAPKITDNNLPKNVGTKNANNGGATLTSTLSKIAIQANLSGTGTKTPTITKNAATNITAAGNATTSEPSSGYYVAVSSAANTGTV